MNTTLLAVIASVVLTATVTQASAVSRSVRSACIGDYLSYCSQHAPSSPGVRSCFRANASKISRGCVSALVKAGYVSKRDRSRSASR